MSPHPTYRQLFSRWLDAEEHLREVPDGLKMRFPRSVQAGIKTVQVPNWVTGCSQLSSGVRPMKCLEAFPLQLLRSVRNELGNGY